MEVLSTSPTQGATNVALDTEISIVFNQAIQSSSVDDASIVVATDKTNLINVSHDGIPQPDDIFHSDDFFSSEFTEIVKGTINVNNDTITFKPLTYLSPNTKYTVYIGTSILGTDDTSLDTIKTLSFTTHEQDIREPLPIEEKLTTIIGTNISFSNSQTSDAFYVTETTPANESFLIDDDTIIIDFNKDIESSQESLISIYVYDIFSDFPPHKLVQSTDYTVTIVGKTITITLDSSLETIDKVVQVKIDKNFSNTDNETLSSSYSLQFIKQLSVYYSSTKLIKLRAGSILSGITDVNLAMMIFYASLNADMLFENTNLSLSNTAFLKKKYALYDTLEMALLNNFAVGINDYVRKQLAEFSIAVSSKTKIELYNKLLDEAKRNKELIKSMIANMGRNGVFNRRSRTSDIGRMWPRNSKPGINSRADTGSRFIMIWDPFSQPINY